MSVVDMGRGGGFQYQWACAALLVLNYLREPVSFNSELHNLITGFLDKVEEIELEGEDPSAPSPPDAVHTSPASTCDSPDDDGSDAGREDINLRTGSGKQILIQVKAKQKLTDDWALGDPSFLKALYHFYEHPSATVRSDNTRFVFLTNRQFNKSLAAVVDRKQADEFTKQSDRLFDSLQKYAERKNKLPLDKDRFQLMLGKTTFVRYLPEDAVAGVVGSLLRGWGRHDWEPAAKCLLYEIAQKSAQRGGTKVNRSSLAVLLGVKEPGASRALVVGPTAASSSGSDLFILHASGDKETVARPLAKALQARTLKVSLEELPPETLDSLDVSIDMRLARCQHGIVILSPSFFAMRWPQQQLDHLARYASQGGNVMLPVWHNIDGQEFRKHSGLLAAPVGVRTDVGLEQTAAELMQRLGWPVAHQSKNSWELEWPVRMAFVRIPKGEFLMGSHPQQDPHALPNEKPQKRVHLDEFYIGRTPVTNAEYRPYVEWGARPPDRWHHGCIPDGEDNCPVVDVTLAEARGYSQWLSNLGHVRVALPQEAEWEKAARGTNGRVHPWGNEERDMAGPCHLKGDRCKFPVDSDLTDASPYDVLVLNGGFWEWCDSLWPDNHSGIERSAKADDAPRVLRGGRDIGSGVRCAARYRFNPRARSKHVGFRLLARLA